MLVSKIEEINKMINAAAIKGDISTKEISDSHHTFGELYKHRIYLFAAICNLLPEIAFKTLKHFDEENDPMFNGDFLAGINTPEGIVTYHIKLEYWDLFKVPEIDRGPKYDGYSDEDVFNRLLSLKAKDKVYVKK